MNETQKIYSLKQNVINYGSILEPKIKLEKCKTRKFELKNLAILEKHEYLLQNEKGIRSLVDQYLFFYIQ
ncbi:unnamed protein product [Paramecium sonneborni]|uniref:Uncharacterized protein n=1 Tax=Paramecium sonneborni TaxID=65129 RepID=A0A8S1RHN5_9CILI|nr:unnamed protein product [Paramecium sonneborni]